MGMYEAWKLMIDVEQQFKMCERIINKLLYTKQNW